MNTYGWIFICISWLAIIVLLIFCFSSLLRADKK